MKAQARDIVSKAGEKKSKNKKQNQILSKAQSRRNKSRELYDIRQESGFR